MSMLPGVGGPALLHYLSLECGAQPLPVSNYTDIDIRPNNPIWGAFDDFYRLLSARQTMIMQTDSISLPNKSNNIIEVSLRQILFNAIGEHEATDNAIAVITTFIKTMTTLVQLLPNLTSVRHSNELMRRYISACQVAIQAESLSILQSKYSSELSNIPEELSLSNKGSPIRSASPDLKIPHLRAKTAPRRSLLQPGTRRSLTMVRRKSCDNDLSLSAACFRMGLNSNNHEASGIPLPPKHNQATQLRRSKTLDVSRSMDFGANRHSFGLVQNGLLSTRKTSQEKKKKLSSPRRLKETEGFNRRNSDVQPFSDAIDVSKSVDWGSFTSSSSCSGNLPNDEVDPEIENNNQIQIPQPHAKARVPSRPRLSLSKLHFSETEKRRALQAESAASKENERRNSQFLQNIEQLVAKASPYDEVFATRTKILNE